MPRKTAQTKAAKMTSQAVKLPNASGLLGPSPASKMTSHHDEDDSSDLSDAPEPIVASPPKRAMRSTRQATKVVPTVASKPRRVATASSSAGTGRPPAEHDELESDTPPPKPKRARKRKLATASTEPGDIPIPAPVVEAEEDPNDEPKPNPKRTRKRKLAATTIESLETNAATLAVEEAADADAKSKPKRARKRNLATATAESAAEEDADDEPKPKKKRAVKPKEPIVYIIPDVERKETTFKGRLGYACLNTVLRNIKPASDSIFASRTCRIDTIEKNGMDYVKGLGLLNVRDLKKMVEWNEVNNIKFMRMSSEMFPFASHPKYGYTLEYAAEDLKAVGDLAKSLGHRLTLHPGQFTQIGSPTKKVVDASVRELEYHCEMMERMGLGPDGVMIIHMGGMYGDKEATIARFKENYQTRLSDGIRARLVLENDEICYNLDDIMPVCEELNIPIVVDYHHDWINPSSRPLSELIPLINKTWALKGIKPKQHLSEPRPGAESVMEKRAHADRCKNLPGPECLADDGDLMIEAKDKEQAVFELYRIYGLADVIHDNLRPPNPNPTLATGGRKSSSPKKAKKATEVDGDAEALALEDEAGDVSVDE